MNMKKTLVLLLAAAAVFSPLRSQEVSGSHYDSVLRRIMEDDQRVRRQLDSLARAGTDVTELLPLYEEMARTDAANQRKALPILEKYLAGTLPLSDESLTTLYYVIQHADLPVQAKYAPFIRSLFERDIITNVEFAWFTDRLLVRQRKAQTYGLQSYVYAGTGDPFLYPVSRKVRKAWRRIGLPVSDLNEILTSFGEGYTPLLLSEEEFALFGHAVRCDADDIGRGVPDVSVRTEDGRTCTTNENGFYALIVNKHDLPGKLIFRYDGRVYEYPFGEFPDTDWEIIDATIP